MARACANCGGPLPKHRGPGRPRKVCGKCERPRGEIRGTGAREAARKRGVAVARERRSSKRRLAESQLADRAALLAVGLRILPDLQRAAEYMGLNVSGRELAELERRAREDHADILEGGAAALEDRTVAVIGLYLHQLTRSIGIVNPGQLAHGAMALAKLIAALRESEPASAGFAQISIGVLGADGTPVSFGPLPTEPEK